LDKNISLPEEVVACAEALAATTNRSKDEIIGAWVQSGMVQQLTSTLMAKAGMKPQGSEAKQTEREELANLLPQHYLGQLDDESVVRLDDLLHHYRQSVVETARSLTDWLAVGRVRRLGSPVGQLVTLRSNMLYAAGYDAEKEVLDVIFKSGGVYRYFDVPLHIYEGLLQAPSVGRYMWDHVLRVYPNVRLDRKRSTRRVLSRERRQLSQAA
jgi:hypothetical protein